MVVVAKKIDWLTVDLYVPVMLMDYSLMNSGSYTCNKSEGLISLSNSKNSFCSSFIRIKFEIYRNPKKSPGLPCAEVTNIFDYIHQESHHHQVTKMCRILGVSRAQYYRYRSPKPSKRRAEDEDLKQRILRIFAEFKQRYGVMKIHHELNLELQPLQLRCSPRRISRLMKELDIHSVTVNKWKAASASKTKVEQRPNLLKQDFSTTGLNQKWTADMTYIQTKRNGWYYLSTIMDLHSRRIIGYSFSKKMATDLVLKTLESAVKNRTITGDLIIHTDLGSQYTSDDYNQRLTELHIRHSYSRKGCPYDNAPMESFHASLKKECVYPVPVFEDYETAAAVLFEYVHAFYNRKRIHSSLGYQTPLQVEIATLTSQMAA
ncbi:DDE domain-containing protein [Lactiplantibacillus plantarum]|nr:DDE domain-containing protein [Lactiplantibacillus plantarum]